MSYIIKSPDELKDPFLCYCVFHRFMEEAGEDYIDYNDRIVNGTPLLFWMLGKGYISDKEIEEVLKRSKGRYIYVSDILKDDAIFKESYGDTSIGSVKSYSILAEYMCQISEFRQRLYDSVYDKATGFENYKFYKDEDKKYLKVREEVEKWIPPTPEHENLKKFCLDQIDMSLNTSLYKWCEKDINKELDTSDGTIRKYIDDLKDQKDMQVNRAYEKYQAELKRVEEKNLWMKQFLDSLENTKW